MLKLELDLVLKVNGRNVTETRILAEGERAWHLKFFDEAHAVLTEYEKEVNEHANGNSGNN